MLKDIKDLRLRQNPPPESPLFSGRVSQHNFSLMVGLSSSNSLMNFLFKFRFCFCSLERPDGKVNAAGFSSAFGRTAGKDKRMQSADGNSRSIPTNCFCFINASSNSLHAYKNQSGKPIFTCGKTEYMFKNPVVSSRIGKTVFQFKKYGFLSCKFDIIFCYNQFYN